MNWVGGARNRLKLKNENKLQKEFFERKRQQKSNARTVITKRMGKIRGKQSQDMSSLEVIMSAHRNEQKRGMEIREHRLKKVATAPPSSKVKQFTRNLKNRNLQPKVFSSTSYQNSLLSDSLHSYNHSCWNRKRKKLPPSATRQSNFQEGQTW